MIKYVLIDIDNTLLDFNKCSENAIKQACLVHGVKYERRIYDAFSTINENFWKQIERGELSKERLHRIRWKTIFDYLGISCDGQAFELSFRSAVTQSAEPVDGADGLLKYLSRKYTVAVASNAAHSQQVSRLEKAGLKKYIDEFFVSWDIGFDKPHAEFFNACIKGLSNPPAETVIMIGDSLTADIIGAKNCGIKTCWFNKFNDPLPDYKIDYVVNDLTDIKNFL